LRGLRRSLSADLPVSMSQVHLTSLAVNGWPSCHLTPCRSRSSCCHRSDGAAQADNDFNRVTLHTSAVHTGVIARNAINVSKRTLNITVSIFDGVIEPGKNSPKLLEGPTLINTPPAWKRRSTTAHPPTTMKGIAYFRSLAPAIGMTCGLFRMPFLPGRAAWTAGRPFSRSS
jgi:hypothetical protein